MCTQQEFWNVLATGIRTVCFPCELFWASRAKSEGWLITLLSLPHMNSFIPMHPNYIYIYIYCSHFQKPLLKKEQISAEKKTGLQKKKHHSSIHQFPIRPGSSDQWPGRYTLTVLNFCCYAWCKGHDILQTQTMDSFFGGNPSNITIPFAACLIPPTNVMTPVSRRVFKCCKVRDNHPSCRRCADSKCFLVVHTRPRQKKSKKQRQWSKQLVSKQQ